MGLFSFLANYDNNKNIKKLTKIANKIVALEETYQQMSDEELKAQTGLFKERLNKGESLDSLLPEAYAVVGEASFRVLKLRPYFVQYLGAIVLHQGRIAEMKTGEGKTLVAVMPSYLNALTGKNVHVVTVNDVIVGVYFTVISNRFDHCLTFLVLGI